MNKEANQYWLDRKLKNVFEYHQLRSINDMIERAKVACQESKSSIVQMTNNNEMIYFLNKIKRTSFYLKSRKKENSI